VQSVAGRVGAVQLQAADVTAGTFAIARIPTISYTALANVPATFAPSAHTHSTSDVVSFTAAAAAAAPVQSVAGRQGAISLAVADVSGLAAVASSGSYTSLQDVPSTFAPQAHTHGTADITGISSSFAAASHTHDAAAIGSGVLDLARIPTIGYTALSGVPTTFAPQAHTHSTADVVGLTAAFSQVGHTHDYVQVLNGLTGTVSITGGAGVTVSTASSSITIAAAGSFSLPTASASTLGGIKVGSGLTITDGVLSRSSSYDPAAAPGAPSGIYYEGGQTGNVRWTASPGGVATTYEVQYTANDGATYTTAASGITSTSYPFVSGYKFRVRGFNADSLAGEWGYSEGLVPPSGGGGSGSDDARWNFFKPPAPTNVVATAGNQSAVVAWTLPTGVLAQTPITDQALQYSTNDGSTWTTYAASGATHLGTSVTGLTNGTPVRFRAAAINGIGQGAWSAASAAVTPSSGIFRPIPAMTGDTSPSGTAGLTSSVRAVDFVEKWTVFAQGGNVSWAAVSVNLCGGSSVFDAPQYAFPEGQKSLISGYTVGIGGNAFWAGVNNWTFEGSDDLSSWTVLHTVAGQTWGSYWQTQNFSLPVPANYRAYRWKFTGDNSNDCGGRNFAALQLVQ
jgi:hypothetical protein